MTRQQFEKMCQDWREDSIFELVEEVDEEFKQEAEIFRLTCELDWRRQEVDNLQIKPLDYEAAERVLTRIFGAAVRGS